MSVDETATSRKGVPGEFPLAARGSRRRSGKRRRARVREAVLSNPPVDAAAVYACS